MQYNYIFGPVASRRLGISLGLDITPDKSCTFNCIYCECGKTAKLTIKREEYSPTEDVIHELKNYLNNSPRLDSITFSGSGEPTLHTGLGKIIGYLKEYFPQYNVTVLTNSSLLYLPEVRKELELCDLVIPSLDAASGIPYKQINRPAHEITCEMVIQGIQQFTQEFKGDVWLEIFVIPGMNNDDNEVERFREILQPLNITKIQLNTLDRPGAIKWLTAASQEELESFAERLNLPAEIVARKLPPRHKVRSELAAKEKILATIKVRPSTINDLASSLGFREQSVIIYIDMLLEEGKAEPVQQQGITFYRGL